MNRECEQFMEDPEKYAAHAADCPECAAFLEEMQRVDAKLAELSVPPRGDLSSRVGAKLPVAPWEGATHRAWRPVVMVVTVIAALAVVFSIASGSSLWSETLGLLKVWMTGIGGGLSLLKTTPQMLAHTSMGVRITIVVLFVGINALFVAMLRRAPKGYDAETR